MICPPNERTGNNKNNFVWDRIEKAKKKNTFGENDKNQEKII